MLKVQMQRIWRWCTLSSSGVGEKWMKILSCCCQQQAVVSQTAFVSCLWMLESVKVEIINWQNCVYLYSLTLTGSFSEFQTQIQQHTLNSVPLSLTFGLVLWGDRPPLPSSAAIYNDKTLWYNQISGRFGPCKISDNWVTCPVLFAQKLFEALMHNFSWGHRSAFTYYWLNLK